MWSRRRTISEVEEWRADSVVESFCWRVESWDLRVEISLCWESEVAMVVGFWDFSALNVASSARPSEIRSEGKKGWVSAAVKSSTGGCGDFVLEIGGMGEDEVIWQLRE